MARPPSRRRGDGKAAGAQPEGRGADAAYQALSRILLEGKLRPGTPLRERQLAEAMGLTRGAVRKLLLRLGHEGKLQIFANRGAFVPQPSDADIRQIYEARKAVEAGLAGVLGARITAPQIGLLRAHVLAERRAQRLGRRDESVKLAGRFHIELVHALGNVELTGIVQRLVARTQMFVALFEPARESGCAPDEHQAIVEALGDHDARRAAAAMLDHLERVQTRVLEHVADEAPPAVADIVRAALAGERAAK